MDPAARSFLTLQLRKHTNTNRPHPIGGYDTPIYSAGLSRPAVVSLSGPLFIDIQGVEVDEVCYIDTFADELYDLTQGRGSPFKPQLHYAYENMERQHEYLQEASPSHGATLQLAFWRTINLGFLPKQKDTPYYDRGIGFRFLDLRYRKNIARCFDGRVFFVTKKGWVGLGPMWTKYRDKVVVFDGAGTPFLLWGTAAREDMAGWKLVGDCDVDGWMDENYHGCEILNEPGESNNVAGQGNSVEGKVLVTRLFVIH